MPSQRNGTKSGATRIKANPSVISSEKVQDPHKPSDTQVLVGKLMAILEEKAPEAIPLLDELITILQPDPKEIVENEKRSRSIIISGMPEAGKEFTASQRQAHTELSVVKILDALDIETKPVEINRMGTFTDGKTRIIKCVFSSQKYFFEAIKKARILRQLPGFNSVYIRRSMTKAEREADKELRREARERNEKECGGEKVYVVYRDKVVKAREIPNLKATFSKNH
ncbi:hypothetical protein Y032_0003g1556 [Ancylostoma ceylanicum]|uniref:Uncharacterized protein n=1 Tax=Ancylostoma ceylanicum TaxID=53326 RepID=A0A016W063_9BILA|nr:hypothetical protein Y032_0003g1556 [Ancylostoma ceylanicum]